MRAVAQEFYVSQPLVSTIFHEVCDAIISEMKESMFPIPTRASWKKSEAIFRQKWGFERAIAALDGKHFACTV